MFITTVTAIYSLGHRLCTLTAVSRSTQPSTLRGTVKWVSAHELSNNNKWRWCLRMVAANLSADSQTQIGWFGLRVGGHPALSLHSSNEPGELSQWLCHNDITINIVVVIIINIIIKFFTLISVSLTDWEEGQASSVCFPNVSYHFLPLWHWRYGMLHKEMSSAVAYPQRGWFVNKWMKVYMQLLEQLCVA